MALELLCSGWVNFVNSVNNLPSKHSMSMRLSSISLIAFLLPGLVFAQQPEPRALGLSKPSLAEMAESERTMVRTKKVLPNKLALERLNADRLVKGLPRVFNTPPARMGEEVVALGAAEGSLFGSGEILASLPGRVDNSALPAFPPIRSQGSIGSCASFSTVYTVGTHMLALVRGTNARAYSDDSTKLSPKFIYSLVNWGRDTGSTITGNLQALINYGAPSWQIWPYVGDGSNSKNYLEWPLTANVWREAAKNRLYQSGVVQNIDTEAGLQNLKSLLANGYLLLFGTDIYGWELTSFSNDPSTSLDNDLIGRSVCWKVMRIPSGHAMTVVGYDDNAWTDINRDGVVQSAEKGALKIANSWGDDWGDGGFVWIAYDALRDVSQVPGVDNTGRSSGIYSAFRYDEVYWITAQQGYTPTLLGEFTVSHAVRDQMQVRLGRSSTSVIAPQAYSNTSDLNARGGAFAFDGSATAKDGTFVMDLSSLQLSGPQRYYLSMSDRAGGLAGQLKEFRLTSASGSVLATATSGVNVGVDGATRHAYIDFGGSGSAPVISSNATASGRVGESFFYRINASNEPTSYSMSTLPAGLHQHGTGSPDIFGTPTQAGSYTVALSATNQYGTGTASLRLEIAPALVNPPVITSNSSASGQVGVSFSYNITATGNATSYGAAGLPAGLDISPGSGAITGTPTQPGISAVALSATNAGGTGTRSLTLSISQASISVPEITSQTEIEGISGSAFLYRIEATNNPTSFRADLLPSTLTVNTTTGVISGKLPSAREYRVLLVATNAQGSGYKYLTINVKGGAIQGPPNDDFANRIPLAGTGAYDSGSNLNASTEAGEPSHASQGSHSAWWSWTAPRTAPVQVTLEGSSFDTVLAAYTGNSVGNLKLVAENDDISDSVKTSQITFNATTGTVYQFAVDGFGNAQGDIALCIAQDSGAAPANDHFANAENLSGISASANGSSYDATAQSGEPNHAGQAASKSIWWKWTATSNGSCTVDTIGSAFDTVLAVYTGQASGESAQMVAVQGGTLPQSSQLAGQQVATFEIGKYEVTWAEWQEVRNWAIVNGYTDLENVGTASGGNYPVNNVSWYDVLKWCNAKSQKSGLTPVYHVSGVIYKTGEIVPSVNALANGYRLPTNAEWEWAARGGVSSQGYSYSGSNDLNSVAWYQNNSGGGTKSVGTKAANELGIYDMSGNLGEWVQDFEYNNYPYFRGGGWNRTSSYCTVAKITYDDDAADRGLNLGFRLARNSGLSTLTTIASDDQSGGSNTSKVSFNTTNGTTYYFAVDGRNGAGGAVALNLVFNSQSKPANDDFANAIVLTGSSANSTANSSAATAQSGEPNHRGYSAKKSLWWTWTAAESGPVRISTSGSAFDTVLAVYTGSSLYSLSEMASSDDANGSSQGAVEFEAVSGTTYQIAVDGYDGESGAVALSISQTSTPSNNDFALAHILDTTANDSASASGSSRKATAETGEPAHAGSNASRSLWWSWTAPHAGSVTIDTIGSSFDTVLAVYTGSNLNSLTEVASSDDYDDYNTSLVTFQAVAGTTYRIAVDGYRGRSGQYELWIEQDEAGGIYETDFEYFPSGFNALRAFDGWADSDPFTGSSGIFEEEPGDLAAWIGYNQTNDAAISIKRIVDVSAQTGKVEYSVDFWIQDSTGPTPRDIFEFSIENRNGDYLAGVAFDNSDGSIKRYFDDSWSAVSNTGIQFENGVEYALTATIDLQKNTWSASLGGQVLFANQTLTTSNKTIDLGAVAANWYPAQTGNPGNNFMVFDNYRIATTKRVPVITSEGQKKITAGQNFEYQIQATQAPDTFSATGLPSGLTCNASTGRITGKPTSSGTQQVTIMASNNAGTGSKLLMLTVEASGVEAPVITSATTASGKVGSSLSYQITATNAAVSYGCSPVPAGLVFNTETGLLSGAPTAAGNYTLALTATNAGGTGNATLSLFIASDAPVINSPTSASGKVGAIFSYQIRATNNPTSFGATGLPSGLLVDSSTGVLSGTPAAAGNYSVTLTAQNANGTGSGTLNVNIEASSGGGSGGGGSGGGGSGGGGSGGGGSGGGGSGGGGKSEQPKKGKKSSSQKNKPSSSTSKKSTIAKKSSSSGSSATKKADSKKTSVKKAKKNKKKK